MMTHSSHKYDHRHLNHNTMQSWMTAVVRRPSLLPSQTHSNLVLTQSCTTTVSSLPTLLPLLMQPLLLQSLLPLLGEGLPFLCNP